MEVWAKRLVGRFNASGLGKAELAREAGLPKESVYKYLKGKVKQPRGDVLDKLADALGIQRLWLKEGLGPELSGYPLVGSVSAGEQFTPVDDHSQGAGLDYVSLDLDATDPIAIQVRGRSMLPAYRDGDMLFCSRQRGLDIARCIGHDCVVMTEGGEGYLKVLKSGTKPGLYTLESYNRAFEDIVDVRLAWVAPVSIVRRPI